MTDNSHSDSRDRRLDELAREFRDTDAEEREPVRTRLLEENPHLHKELKSLFADHEQREQRLDELFGQFDDADPKERESLRERMLEENPDLRQELELLFADHDQLATLTTAERPAFDDAAELTPGSQVDDFEVLETLARGGMGVVYKARDLTLNRLVALKMIRGDLLLSRKARQRFSVEAKLTAQLEHPNIVRVYRVGEYEGSPYFAMQLVEGAHLGERAKQQAFTPRQIASTIKIVAQALQAAHDAGILHRDLKPANILLTREDVPLIADFGLAKMLQSDSDAALTDESAFLGTSSYMSPEQASGRVKDLSRASDVYGLGAILYELLTGRPPFLADSPMQTLHDVVNGQLVSPRRVDPKIPRDLETICLKCLEKDPAQRCDSARQVAQYLQLYLDGKPLPIRPVPRRVRVWRWCKRNPLPAGLLATVLSLAAAIVVVVVVSSLRIQDIIKDTDDILRDTVDTTKATEDIRKVTNRRKQYVKAIHDAQRELLDGDQGAHATASRLLKKFIPEDSQGEGDLRGFEWRLLMDQVDPKDCMLLGHEGEVQQLAASPDGRWLASVCSKGAVRFWNLSTGELAWVPGKYDSADARCVAFSPDSRTLAIGDKHGKVTSWDTLDGRQFDLLLEHGSAVKGVAFSPDGNSLASWGGVDHPVKLWTWRTGASARAIGRRQGIVNSVAFHPVVDLVAVASQGGGVKLWEIDGSDPPGPFRSLTTGKGVDVLSVVISPCGRWLAAKCRDGRARVWNLEKILASGNENGSKHAERADGECRDPDGESILSLAFVPLSGDSADLILAGGLRSGGVSLWDVGELTRAAKTTPTEDPRPADPKSGSTKELKMEATEDLSAEPTEDPNPEAPEDPKAASTQRPSMVATDEPKTAPTADTPTRLLTTLGPPHEVRLGRVSGLAFVQSPDRQASPLKLAAAGQGIMLSACDTADEAVQLRTASFGRPGRQTGPWPDRLLEPIGKVTRVSFSHDSRLLATCEDGDQDGDGEGDPTVRLWILSSQVATPFWKLPELQPNDAAPSIYHAVFSPTEGLLAMAPGAGQDKDEPGYLSLWDVRWPDQGDRPVVTLRVNFPAHDKPISAVAFSRDGKILATAGYDRTVKLWDVHDLKPNSTEPEAYSLHEGGAIRSVSFSPDGLMATANDETVRLWNPKTLEEVGRIPAAHPRSVLAVAFSPDGKRLATGGADGSLKQWDVSAVLDGSATAVEPKGETNGHRHDCRQLAFSPDGRTLASASEDETVRLWNTATGLDMIELVCRIDEGSSKSRNARFHCLAFSPDGTMLAAGTEDGAVALWRAPPVNKVE